jgi:hypothetical protein
MDRKIFRNYKERGEWVELRFMTKAIEQGFMVSKPWGDSTAYDVGVDDGRRVLRIQVKSTTFRMGNGYLCRLRPNPATAPYTVDQLDFFAAYIIPQDVWYLMPVGVILKRCGDVMLCPVEQPKQKRFRYEYYREAWDLMRAGTTSSQRQSVPSEVEK